MNIFLYCCKLFNNVVKVYSHHYQLIPDYKSEFGKFSYKMDTSMSNRSIFVGGNKFTGKTNRPLASQITHIHVLIYLFIF